MNAGHRPMGTGAENTIGLNFILRSKPEFIFFRGT